ncbi:MAG: hypothetical protein M3019_06195 [Candidatus Dormibacteraeota bacterium]|nr:hypothetical protein [Candidatus Dormibacteraeota bacterium]
MATVGIGWRSAIRHTAHRASGLGHRRASTIAVAAVTAAGAGLLTSQSPATAANPTPPFSQCPAVGVDTSCAILIVIQPDGSLTILNDASQKPFDKGDDTLLGVVNNSGITVPSLSIGSSTQAVFAFEGDGLCTFVFTGNGYCKATPKPATGYEGPDSRFTNISANKRDGTVAFTAAGGGLAAGAATYFALENSVNPTKLGTGVVTSLAFTPTSATTSDNADTATLSAVLMSGGSAIPNAPVTFTLAPGPASTSCTATSNASGVASCALIPHQAAGAYQVVASYLGSSVPFLAPVDTRAPFAVTLEQDGLAYTGSTAATAGQPLNLAALLTTDDPAAGTAMEGRTVKLTLGSGAAALSCNGLTDATGLAHCLVFVPAMQSPGLIAASAAFVSDTFYRTAAAGATVEVPEPAVIAAPAVGAANEVAWSAIFLLLLGGGALVGAGRRRG